jgi:hypothetical protein
MNSTLHQESLCVAEKDGIRTYKLIDVNELSSEARDSAGHETHDHDGKGHEVGDHTDHHAPGIFQHADQLAAVSHDGAFPSVAQLLAGK